MIGLTKDKNEGEHLGNFAVMIVLGGNMGSGPVVRRILEEFSCGLNLIEVERVVARNRAVEP